MTNSLWRKRQEPDQYAKGYADAMNWKTANHLEHLPVAQPAQEPVALQMDVIVVNLVREGINKHRARELAEHFIKHTTPPQRTWVGLTPQERDEINEQVYGAVPHHVAFHHAIEAKLKEKNNIT